MQTLPFAAWSGKELILSEKCFNIDFLAFENKTANKKIFSLIRIRFWTWTDAKRHAVIISSKLFSPSNIFLKNYTLEYVIILILSFVSVVSFGFNYWCKHGVYSFLLNPLMRNCLRSWSSINYNVSKQPKLRAPRIKDGVEVCQHFSTIYLNIKACKQSQATDRAIKEDFETKEAIMSFIVKRAIFSKVSSCYQPVNAK